MKNVELDLGGKEIGMAMTIVRDARQTNGRSFEMKWEVFSSADSPPLHIHPSAVETYEILEGQMEFFIARDWIRAKKGDKLKVEKGVPHTFRNRSGKSAIVYNTHQPAMDYEGFFCGLHNLSRSGLLKGKKLSFKGMLGIATLYTNYSDEIVSVKPPAYVIKAMSFLGKRMGINFK